MQATNQEYTVIQKNEESSNQRQSPKYSYFSHNTSQDEMIRKLVLQAVGEQMPLIIAQVRDAVLKDLQQNNSSVSVASQVSSNVEREVLQKLEQVEANKVEIKYPEIQEQPKIEVRPAAVEEERKIPYENNDNFHKSDVEVDFIAQNAEPQSNAVNKPQMQVEKPGIFDHVKKFGADIKKHISELPNVAKAAIDDISGKNDKDPIVQIEEGRYPKSAVEKVASLQDFFPEANKKELLDFTMRFPAYATLEQLADAFIRKDEFQPAVVVDNNNQANVANNQ